jgi:hypothetical protein
MADHMARGTCRRRRDPARPPLRLSTLLAGVAAAATLATTTGCRPRALAPSAADRLREELVVRTAERDVALARASELETRLAEVEADAVGGADPEIVAATPRVARIEVSSLSAARRLAVDSSAGEGATGRGTVALVLVPRDGLGRFLQVAGRLEATFAVLVPGEPPLPGATVRLSPAALRDRYRTGFLGEHYTVEAPIEWDPAKTPRSVAVSAEFVDGASGRRFPVTATLPFVPDRPAPRGESR